MRFRSLKEKSEDVKQARNWLIESLRMHLLPPLTQQGFESAPLAHRGPMDRELVLSHPLGRLRRVREEGAVDLVEIQFARYGRAAFRVMAGVAPKGGLMTLTGHWVAEDLYVGWLNEYFVMSASCWRQAWFSVWNWPHQSVTQRDYDSLALRAASLVPELELAVRGGKLGPHMRRVVIPRPIIAERTADSG